MARETTEEASSLPTPVLLMVRELGIGGCENDLTKIATGIDRRRFAPHVGCLYARGMRLPQLEAAGVPILELPIRGVLSRSWLRGSRNLLRYIRDHGIRIVHTFDAPMDMVAVPVGWAARVPVLIKSHLWYRGTLPRSRQLWLYATDHMVDAIVVNSRAVQRELVEQYRVREDQTYLCYNGVNTEVFNPGSRADGGESGPLTIGTICALRDEKRVDVLLDAFAELRRRGVDARLVVVGSGPMLEPLQAQSRRVGIADATQFIPGTSDVAQWMRHIDIFALTSETESFPNALLEAMACGCCIVASDVGGVSELVRPRANGVLFEPGDTSQLADALQLLSQDPPLRQTLGAAAARTARDEFSVSRFVQRCEDLYVSLLARKIPAPCRPSRSGRTAT